MFCLKMVKRCSFILLTDENINWTKATLVQDPIHNFSIFFIFFIYVPYPFRA